MTEQEAVTAVMRAYARAAAKDLAENGVSWDIIPERRLMAIENPKGWTVQGYSAGTAMLFDEPPISAWSTIGQQCRQIQQ